MKRLFCCLLIIVLVLTLSLAAGCKPKIKAGKDYHLYTYDAKSDRFVKMGASLSFGKDLSTFEYTFSEGDLTIYGGVEHTEKPDSYTISCSEEIISLVTERYRKSLVDGGAEQSKIDLFDAIAATITPRTQYFAYDGKLFTGSAVELFRVAEDGCDSFEGLYRTDSNTDIIRLRGGFVYSEDENGECTVKSGRYSVSRGILTIISMDEKGNDRYQNGILMRKRYLTAKITIPSDGELLGTSMDEQIEKSAFVTKINADISDYSGKTIAVLCESFLSNDMK